MGADEVIKWLKLGGLERLRGRGRGFIVVGQVRIGQLKGPQERGISQILEKPTSQYFDVF